MEKQLLKLISAVQLNNRNVSKYEGLLTIEYRLEREWASTRARALSHTILLLSIPRRNLFPYLPFLRENHRPTRAHAYTNQV